MFLRPIKYVSVLPHNWNGNSYFPCIPSPCLCLRFCSSNPLNSTHSFFDFLKFSAVFSLITFLFTFLAMQQPPEDLGCRTDDVDVNDTSVVVMWQVVSLLKAVCWMPKKEEWSLPMWNKDRSKPIGLWKFICSNLNFLTAHQWLSGERLNNGYCSNIFMCTWCDKQVWVLIRMWELRV